MSYEYNADINILLYKYIQSIYVTETEGLNHDYYVVRLNLDNNNFNFSLSSTDGGDLHFSDMSNGSNIYKHWIAYWRRISDNIATIFVSIPNMVAYERRRIFVIWGGPLDYISDRELPGAFFTEDFLDYSGIVSRWDCNYDLNSSYMDTKGYSISSGFYIYPKSSVLLNKTFWTVEYNSYWYGANCSSQLSFLCSENEFGIQFGSGSTRSHNIVKGGSYISNNGNYFGGEVNSFNRTVVSYTEKIDSVIIEMRERNTYPDSYQRIERSVYGDTWCNNFRIHGPTYVYQGVYDLFISWLLIRDFRELEPVIDYNDLFVPYEWIPHSNQDYTEYSNNIITSSTLHYLTLDNNGDPYKLSNGVLNDPWVSGENAASLVDGLGVIIDFGCYIPDLTLIDYIHFDGGSEGGYRAVKLSDDNDDVNGENVWKSTSEYNYAAIDFDEDVVAVGGLYLRMSEEMSSGSEINFNFYGGFEDPRFYYDNWFLLTSGTINSTNWFSYHFSNESKFRYYKLVCSGTENIVLQDWRMYENITNNKPRLIRQIRLLPDFENSQQIYFPKHIRISASNDDSDNWIVLNQFDTYTPFYEYTHGRWQYYSIGLEYGSNYHCIDPYFRYRIDFIGNWNGNVGKQVVAALEMVELSTEDYSYRILYSENYFDNSIKAVWAKENSGIDGIFYFSSNGYINKVSNNKLVKTIKTSTYVEDLNLIF